MLRSRGGDVSSLTGLQLVIDFVKESLVHLAPGRLRTAYAKHAAAAIGIYAKNDQTAEEDLKTRLTDLLTVLLNHLTNVEQCASDNN